MHEKTQQNPTTQKLPIRAPQRGNESTEFVYFTTLSFTNLRCKWTSPGFLREPIQWIMQVLSVSLLAHEI